jgi:serine/threonine protein kinase
MSTQSTVELAVGSEFAGYRIEEVAARGGMGVVYRAVQVHLTRTVALKLVTPALARDPAFRERFRREWMIAASIDHPNVIPVYQAGEEDGALFIAMRWVAGTNLRQLIDQGPLEPSRAAHLISQVAYALDAAHEQELIHRDVKPANILITGQDHVYLSDFGLTKHASSISGLTKTGQWVGTVEYTAPEQIEGSTVSARGRDGHICKAGRRGLRCGPGRTAAARETGNCAQPANIARACRARDLDRSCRRRRAGPDGIGQVFREGAVGRLGDGAIPCRRGWLEPARRHLAPPPTPSDSRPEHGRRRPRRNDLGRRRTGAGVEGLTQGPGL